MPGFLPTSEAGKFDDLIAEGVSKSVSGQGMGRARATMADINYVHGPLSGRVTLPSAEASHNKSGINAEASIAKVKHISKQLRIDTVLSRLKEVSDMLHRLT